MIFIKLLFAVFFFLFTTLLFCQALFCHFYIFVQCKNKVKLVIYMLINVTKKLK